MLTKLKIILILAALLLGSAQTVVRFESLITPELQPLSLIAYTVLLGLCLVGIFSAAFIPVAAIRWSFALLISLAGIMVETYQSSVADDMPYDAFISMINASGSLHEAWGQYAGAIMIGGVQALLLFFGIGLSIHHVTKKHSKKLIAAPLLILFVLAGVLFIRGGDGARGLPASYTGAAYAMLYGYERSTEVIAPREPVRLPVVTPRNGDGDIVMLVDESISGQYLDINSDRGVYSGLMAPKNGVTAHNFGLASSIAHCSAAVNMTLRHGGTRDDYVRINGSMPSIWAYAKRAGMETVYIDVPRTNRIFNNLMNESEMKDVDQWIEFDDVPIQRRDHAAADTLAGFLNDGKRQFIYLQKIGAHFPIHDKYPDEYMRYRPALPRGRFLNISDTGDRAGFSGSRMSWVTYRNAYRNTLIWNVGAFFDRLLGQADLAGSTIIYTSDHGQNLHERGGTGVVTHCSPDPKPEEGLVPLVVLDRPQAAGQPGAIDWDAAIAKGRNRSSHFQIFPTVLEMMGYEPKAVQAIYGADLLTANTAPFGFNYQFNARLGRAPSWKEIRLDEIAWPPASDFQPPAKPGPKQKIAVR
ncbi:sulfatase-like hydrolase/transferase [Sphingorhabdus sp. M41]|uniref:sulfatase-like hydrolase/transferase n=1 Tax=Sphingorhabdus sp. M41 TaxID=1806885 RepID=UPI000B0000FF|nr:sulfatase-like hydrolase/transferase [Sphingorhabdus sp. M41]